MHVVASSECQIDCGRRLKLFKWHRHTEGKLLCVQGILQDINMRQGSDSSFDFLGPEVVGGLFREAQDKGTPDDVIRLSETLTQGGVKLDRFQQVVCLIRIHQPCPRAHWSRQQEVPGGPCSQIGVILAHLKINQSVAAFNLLLGMYEQGHALPERVSSSIAEQLSKHANAVDESYYLLESRKAAGCAVPIAAVNMVIEACALMEDLDRAFATWAELEQLELTPNTGTYNALLHTCIRTREISSGHRLLSRMSHEEIAPDAITFMHKSALHVMAREDRAALDVLGECKNAGIVPDGRMYVSLINLHCRRRRGKDAQVGSPITYACHPRKYP